MIYPSKAKGFSGVCLRTQSMILMSLKIVINHRIGIMGLTNQYVLVWNLFAYSNNLIFKWIISGTYKYGTYKQQSV